MRVEIEKREVYVAEDGERFTIKMDCERHDAAVKRKNTFADLKAKVDAIEHIENSCAPFGYGYIDEERYEYLWFRPKSVEEVETLNEFFSTSVELGRTLLETVGEWVGIEIDGGYEGYTGKEDVYPINTPDNSVEMLARFYSSLGYDIEIKKRRLPDAYIEMLWEQLTDVPLNPETECIEQPFWKFPVGTTRDTIWHWFDEQHSKGVAYLLYDRKESE